MTVELCVHEILSLEDRRYDEWLDLYQSAFPYNSHCPQRIGYADRQDKALWHDSEDYHSHFHALHKYKMTEQRINYQQQLEKKRYQ